MITSSPIQELEPGATPFAVVGVALLLSSRTADSLKTKKYFDYDYKIPPKESNLRKGLAGRGMGALVDLINTYDIISCRLFYLYTSMYSIASQSIYTSTVSFSTEMTSVSLL